MRTASRASMIYVGWMLSTFFSLSSAALAEPPEIKISVDSRSINQMLSHLQGSIFTNTWDAIPLRPTLSLQVNTAKVITMHHTSGTIDLHLKGKVQLHYAILEAEQHASFGFTAQLQTRPVSTETAIILQVLKVNTTLDDPPISDEIELSPIQDLIRATLLPETIPLLDMQNLQKIGIPLPGKPPVTVHPTTPRIRVGKDRLILFITLQIESSP